MQFFSTPGDRSPAAWLDSWCSCRLGVCKAGFSEDEKSVDGQKDQTCGDDMLRSLMNNSVAEGHIAWAGGCSDFQVATGPLAPLQNSISFSVFQCRPDGLVCLQNIIERLWS